ncbi:thioredoxin [Candidatus Dependentiae bacterium]|nr:thioredoxin [Candidatus Dependentiae bacterium]
MFKKFLLLSLLPTAPLILKAQNESVSQTHMQTGSVIHLYSIQQFDTLIKEYNRVVVDFYAPWCSPCNRMSPMMDELAQEFNDILFIKINIDNMKQLVSRYSIMSIPTFMFFKNGNHVHRFTGIQSKSTMRNEIRSRIG